MAKKKAVKSGEAETILSGLRVVELGSGLAAPLAGMLLAEQGAEVLRVVPKGNGAQAADPVLDALLARGKTEIALDLSEPADLQTLHRFLAQADVALEDATQRERLVELDSLRETVNPGLVTCHIPPFPDGDPRASLPGHEAIAGAAGFLYNKPVGMPRYHDFPIGSITSALYAVNGVMAALIARLRTQRGQRVDVARYHANLNSQVVQILIKAGVPRGFLPLKMIGSPFMRCWQCQDERYVYLHITLPTHNARMLELLAEHGYADEVAELRNRIMSPETMRDPSQVKSIPEAKKIKAIYDAIFRSRPAQDWEEILGAELCCIKVRQVEEWLRDSLEAGMTDAAEVEDPVFGPLLGPGACVASPDHPPVVGPRRLGEQVCQELLDRWESTPRPTAVDTASSQPLAHPLSGVKVLDLSRVIAGPCAARVLAELGADVISVQSDTRLDWALSFHLIFNAGKRSVTLDFTDDAGKETLWKLIDSFKPDALIHNYRHLDLARTIGVGPETVRERYPAIAYTHLNAYGNDGIWKDRPGFEQVVQAVSGIQLAYAEGGRPKLLPSPIIDIGCGLLGAYGTLLSLYKQKRTGQGAVATTHLTNVSVLLQILRVADFQRDAALERARERGHSLVHDAERGVAGGVVWTLGTVACLAGPRRDLRRWLAHLGIAAANGASAGREIELARKHLYKRPLSYWQKSIIEAGLRDSVALLAYPSMRKIVEEIRLTDHRREPIVRKRAFRGSPQELTFLGNPIQLSDTPLVDVDTPPQRGADTQAVLGALGVQLEAGAGVQEYPPSKSLVVWLGSFVRWGYFAWKSGNI